MNEVVHGAQRSASEFPDHIVMRVDLVRALVKNRSWQQALDILEETSTLPFEGAREIHDLFVTCQVQLGLQTMKAAEYAAAIEYLDGSMQYPETLPLDDESTEVDSYEERGRNHG